MWQSFCMAQKSVFFAGNLQFNGTMFNFGDMRFDLIKMERDFGEGFFVYIEIKKQIVHLFTDADQLVDGFDEMIEIAAFSGVAKTSQILFDESDNVFFPLDGIMGKRIGFDALQPILVFVIYVECIGEGTTVGNRKFDIIKRTREFFHFAGAQLPAGHFDDFAIDHTFIHGNSFFLYLY